MKTVHIYTDGACRHNPGPGGWGAILVYGEKEKELSGGEPMTTNNRMELLSAIVAFEALKEPCQVIYTSDSQYVINGLEKKWAEGWKKKGWKKSDGSPAQNADLWDRLLQAIAPHSISYDWVRGHAGHPYNERCDKLATQAADLQKTTNTSTQKRS
jgi:ribonuclease HI